MNYQLRLKKLSSRLKSIGCDALLIEHPVNILYLTGIELSTGKLLVTASGEGNLLVDGRYIEVCRQKCALQVYLSEEMPLKEWMNLNSIQNLAFESDKTSYQNYLTLQKLQIVLIPVESPVQKLRMIKDQEEIGILTEAAQLGWEGYEFIKNKLQPGISEAELAFELEFFWRKKGAKGVAFDPIIAFGRNSSMPHYRAGSTVLHSGMNVLIDIGVAWKNYHSDMTRTLFFGEPQPEIQAIYTIVEEAKEKALSLCKPGALVGDLDRAARGHITENGYGQYFSHSLGHGLGLDVHEPPTLRTTGIYSDLPLEAGMVITIEPGIYLPGLGGVRLEDTIVLTESGYINLTKNINS